MRSVFSIYHQMFTLELFLGSTGLNSVIRLIKVRKFSELERVQTLNRNSSAPATEMNNVVTVVNLKNIQASFTTS